MTERFLTTVVDRASGDHVCWPFRGPDEYVGTTRDYVAEGLDRHQQVTFVDVDADAVRCATVTDMGQVGRGADGSGPVLAPLATTTAWATPGGVVADLERRTRVAVGEGYAGLRVLTDATDVFRTPDGRTSWMRTEHLIDRLVLASPLTVLCGYDVDDLGEGVVVEAARLHALTRGDLSPLLLRAGGDGALALSGEVDAASAHHLSRAVLSIAPELPRRVVLDASDLRFIDHAGLLALERVAESLALEVALVDASPTTAWLVRTMGLTHVAVPEST